MRGEVAAAVERANEQLSRVEQIKRHALLTRSGCPGGEELTPTMKLKRKPITAKYAAEIEALYARADGKWPRTYAVATASATMRRSRR